MENKVDGYRELDKNTVDMINGIKSLEKNVAELWRYMQDQDTDKRELALAKTHFEEGFMHFVKAVAKPDSVW